MVDPLKFKEILDTLKTKSAGGNGTAIFYSGNNNENFRRADECWGEHKDTHYTINQTEAGEYLKSKAVTDFIPNGSPEYNQLWSQASKMFAEQARGNVIAFVQGAVRPGSDFVTQELPILLGKGNSINGIDSSIINNAAGGNINANLQKVLDSFKNGSHDGCEDPPPPDNPLGISVISTVVKLADSLFKLAGIASRCDPLIIDMAGNGIQLDSWQASNALFDLTGDGTKEDTGWTKANGDDAFLVIDKNNDGKINDISEMFGNASIPGFTELAANDNLLAKINYLLTA